MVKVDEVKHLRCVCHDKPVRVKATDWINSIMCEAELYCSVTGECLGTWSYGSVDRDADRIG